MNKGKAFFESYNMAVETAYESYFKVAEKIIIKGLQEDDGILEGYLSKEIGKWEETSLSELDGNSPAQFIGQMYDFKEIMELFHLGANMCDESLPAVFLQKFQSFGGQSTENLLELSRKALLNETSDDVFQTSQLAIKILGIWKVEQAIGSLIELLYKGIGETELLFENVKEALVNIGKPAIPALIKNIETDGFKSEAGDYMLIALSEIGEHNKSDAIYKCLKSAFSAMPDKSIGAICLGNYGDGRAVPALRGYLEKNKGDISRDLFYDIVSSINKLGGNTDDIVV